MNESLSEEATIQTPVRRSERHVLYRDLAIVYEGYSESIPLRVPDISTHGMFINTPRIFPESAVLRVKFRLNRSGVEVNARAEVRYCLAGVGIGVEFVDISPEAQQAIEEEMKAARAAAASPA